MSWWKEAVIYQIYPRSFKDSNGDGVGDLKGITQQLDYLKKMGIDIIWISPIFKSPNDDNGYDVSDYCDIMDEFGTMADFDEMLQGIHQRGMRLILDLVANHSSDEHHWFQEARKSKDNPYRDYYFWKKEKPNNWLSFFSGDAWEYDEQAGEYYLHLFSKKQPDLNWENPKVREEIYNAMRFWFDKGIDGFRMDVLPFISKRLDFPDIDVNDFGKAIVEVYSNGPRLHEFLHEMNRKVSSQYDIMTMGEGIGVTTETVLDYVAEDQQELNMLYHFDHAMINYGQGGKFDPVDWKLSTFKQIFSKWHHAVGKKGWINVYLDNHDFPRMVSRFGNDGAYREQSAKLLATLLLTLRGTPCIYQGSEIGMTNVAFDSLEDYKDIEIVNAWAEIKEKGGDEAAFLKAVHIQGRDNARTPIQWDASPHAGFTTGTPWIKVNPNYTHINAKAALANPTSIFYYYQKMLQLRKQYSTLIYGDYEDLMPDSEQLYAYRRWDENGEFLVLLNFSDEKMEAFPKPKRDAALIIGNYEKEGKVLKAWEARVYRC